MARLYPFRALRYDPTRVDMTDVVTQPYDKITPAMQERYYQASPYNLIRVILGKQFPKDDEQNNVYTRAAETLDEWRADGILREESEPALYGYSQTYTVPGTQEVRERRGFIALGQLYDYADHVVYRHEQTFPKHKSDRLALFKATRAYCEQIYMLYSDPTFTAERAIFESGDQDTGKTRTRTPDLEITDEYNVLHRVWKLTDPSLIQRVLDAMEDKWLLIADGHHRYETSTTYMHERATELGLDDSAENLSSRPERATTTLSSRPEPSQSHRYDAVERPAVKTATTLPAPPFPEAAIAVPEKTSEGHLPSPPFPEAAIAVPEKTSEGHLPSPPFPEAAIAVPEKTSEGHLPSPPFPEAAIAVPEKTSEGHLPSPPFPEAAIAVPEKTSEGHLPSPPFPEAAIAVPEKTSEGHLPSPPFPEAAMMMTFVNMDAPGITILPTHRVAFGLIGFTGRKFAERAEQYFTVEEIPTTPDGRFPGAATLLARLNHTPGLAFIAATREGDFLLTPKPDAIAPLLAGLSPRQAALDVTQLHKVVLEKLLGLNEETVRAGSHVRYIREASDALQQLGAGNADVVFLIKPVTLDQMRDISLNLEVMPQKSTDFYPKLLSGLAMYTLD